MFFVKPALALDKKELNLDFFEKFNDPHLYQYALEAIENNHSAKQATARVEQYRQRASASLGKELPSLSIGASYLGTHTPDLGNTGAFNIDESAFVVPLIASYEADLLLKNRDKTKSAKKSYEISAQDEKAAYIALLTDVATVYTNILQYDKLIENQNQIIQNAELVYSANKKKFEHGVIDSATLNNSENSLLDVKNNLETYISQRDTLLMELAVLTGKSSECASLMERGSLDNFEYAAQIPSEIKSEIVFSRPDVLAAEKNLEKAKIDVRVARKELFPRFNITGIWAFSTIAGGSFLSWDSSLAALLGGATFDLFKGGQKIANLKLYKAKYEELFENYKEVDIQALKEVNTALCVVKHDTEIDTKVKAKLSNEEKNLAHAQNKLNRGVISNPEYLTQNIKFLNQKQEAANTKAQRLVNYYTLYKATGGAL